MLDWLNLFWSSFAILNLLFMLDIDIARKSIRDNEDLKHQGKHIPGPEWEHVVCSTAVLQMVLEESPECHREQTNYHWLVGLPDIIKVPALLVLLDLREHVVEEREEPNVVLICDDLVEENEVANDEALTVEERPMPNQVEGEEGQDYDEGKSPTQVS